MSSSSSRSAASKKPSTRVDRGDGGTTPKLVACPQCGASVAWHPANPYRPFCSERCKMIDLGAWATESYRIPVQDDKDAPEDQAPGPQ